MIPLVLTVGMASCLCCGGSLRNPTSTPAAEVAPNLTPIDKKAPSPQAMQEALDLIALKRSVEAIERLGDESEAAERFRKMEVEMATGSSLRDALHVVYGESWFTSSFLREVHAQLVAHDALYLSKMRKLVQSPVRSIWPSGRESFGEQIFRAKLMSLLPKSLRPAKGSPGGYRIRHQIELGNGEALTVVGTKSKMKSFECIQTLELWSGDGQPQFRTTLASRLLGISPNHALTNRGMIERASDRVVARLIAQFLAEAELGHFQVDWHDSF